MKDLLPSKTCVQCSRSVLGVDENGRCATCAANEYAATHRGELAATPEQDWADVLAVEIEGRFSRTRPQLAALLRARLGGCVEALERITKEARKGEGQGKP